MGLLRYKILNGFLVCIVYNDIEKPPSCHHHVQNWTCTNSFGHMEGSRDSDRAKAQGLHRLLNAVFL